MKLTEAQIRKIVRLANGDTMSLSSLKGEVFSRMLDDGVIRLVLHGSHKSVMAPDGEKLREYVLSKYNIGNLEEYLTVTGADDVMRSALTKVAGDSKRKSARVLRGFMANSYTAIEAWIGSHKFNIEPTDGVANYIYQWQNFKIPEDVIVVGIENVENFHNIHRQKWLFDGILSSNARLLFVSRYTKNSDLMSWLKNIPNRYIHFGDLDLAGVQIYLREYYDVLGDRAEFLIPSDFDKRIKTGNPERYDVQYQQCKNMRITDPRVKQLVESIHSHHRGYDQEGLIISE